MVSRAHTHTRAHVDRKWFLILLSFLNISPEPLGKQGENLSVISGYKHMWMWPSVVSQTRHSLTVEPQIKEEQCGHCPGQLFTLAWLLENHHRSLPIQSAHVLWTWRRLTTVSPGRSCGGYGGMGYQGSSYDPFGPFYKSGSCFHILGRKSNFHLQHRCWASPGSRVTDSFCEFNG